MPSFKAGDKVEVFSKYGPKQSGAAAIGELTEIKSNGWRIKARGRSAAAWWPSSHYELKPG